MANKNGLYDAADWLKARMPKPDEPKVVYPPRKGCEP